MIFNYAINNPSGYDAYPPVAMPTIAQSGAEILVADYQSEGKEGSPGRVTIVLRFESRDAAESWYGSDDYQAAKAIRVDNADGVAILCDGFVIPE